MLSLNVEGEDSKMKSPYICEIGLFMYQQHVTYLAGYALVELPVALVHVDLPLSADAEPGDAVHGNGQLAPDRLLRLGFGHNL